MMNARDYMMLLFAPSCNVSLQQFFVIMVSSLPGKYWNSVLKMLLVWSCLLWVLGSTYFEAPFTPFLNPEVEKLVKIP